MWALSAQASSGRAECPASFARAQTSDKRRAHGTRQAAGPWAVGSMSDAAPVVSFVRDLVFSAKVREVADRLGIPVKSVRDPRAFPGAARGARVVIVDLRLPEAIDVLGALAGDPETSVVVSVGFVGHEERSLMEAARAAGCRHVLAKGEFAAKLPQLLGSG